MKNRLKESRLKRKVTVPDLCTAITFDDVVYSEERIAFHRQAGALLSRTGRAIKNAPVHMKAAKKATRISCAGFALSAAIAVKPKSEIKPATRPQQEGRPRIVYSAKCN